MVDTVTSTKIYGPSGFEAGRARYKYNFTNESDGTGESAVTKIDVSTLQAPNRGNVAVAGSKIVIEEIEWSIGGFSHVTVAFDATNDDEIAVCSGDGYRNFLPVGGFADPQSSGYTGDIKFTTAGNTTAGSYNITITFRVK